MAAAPLLVVAALMDAPRLFVTIAACGLLSDALDGPLARAARSDSARGAALDSQADVALCSALLIGSMMLLPAPLRAERGTMAVVVAAYVLPIAIGWFKFRTLTSYHTILARISLVLLPVSVVVCLAAKLTWPIHGAAALFALSALEEIAITYRLAAPRHDIAHLLASVVRTSPSPPES